VGAYFGCCSVWYTKLAHVIWGSLTFLSTILLPSPSNVVSPVIMFMSFMIYEKDEERTIKDPMYQEVLEYSLGYGATLLIYVLTRFLIG